MCLYTRAHSALNGGVAASKAAGQSLCTSIVKKASLAEGTSMDTCEHKEPTSLPLCPALKEHSWGVSRRERGGPREKKGPRPGPNGGNSAEVKPSFCLLWIKEAFEKQRVFLSHGGPSGL